MVSIAVRKKYSNNKRSDSAIIGKISLVLIVGLFWFENSQKYFLNIDLEYFFR